MGALDAEHINSLCVRRDQYGGLFWQVSPGVYEATDDTGIGRLTVESPARLHYYREGVYSGGYTSFTESIFEWYSDFE